MDNQIKVSPRKKQIEREAAELFMQRGYTAATMRDLAQKVGIEAGSLYSHYKSKESILQNICFRKAHGFMKSLDEIEHSNDSMQIRLEKAIKSHIQVLLKDPKETSVFQLEWKHLSDPYLSDFAEMRKDYENRFLSIIEKGVKNGEFSVEDPYIFTVTLLSALNNTLQWLNKSEVKNPDLIAGKLIDIFFQGIKTK